MQLIQLLPVTRFGNPGEEKRPPGLAVIGFFIDFAFAFVMLRILAPEGAGIYYYAIVVFGWFVQQRLQDFTIISHEEIKISSVPFIWQGVLLSLAWRSDFVDLTQID